MVCHKDHAMPPSDCSAQPSPPHPPFVIAALEQRALMRGLVHGVLLSLAAWASIGWALTLLD
ncbi:MAG: hypothetical protein B7Z80_02610 [Rhodospirillales bacterium 20-64-7]|nr:MAG: hypothetical protein B7Z80_02610 [Rhodospirillales bacterium 20-64-7]